MEETNLTKTSRKYVFDGNHHKVYATDLFIGHCPEEIKEMYMKVINFSESQYCLVLPRFAHVLVLKKT
jgi:hypothetical protein